MISTSATFVALMAEKKNAMLMPNSAPPGAAFRIVVQESRRPVTNNPTVITTAPIHSR